MAEEGHGPGTQATGTMRGTGMLVRAQASDLGGGAEASVIGPSRASLFNDAREQAGFLKHTGVLLVTLFCCPVLLLRFSPFLKSLLQNRGAQF